MLFDLYFHYILYYCISFTKNSRKLTCFIWFVFFIVFVVIVIHLRKIRGNSHVLFDYEEKIYHYFFKKKREILLNTLLIIFIVKNLQKVQISTNLRLWTPICRKKLAITPKWINSYKTNLSTYVNYLIINVRSLLVRKNWWGVTKIFYFKHAQLLFFSFFFCWFLHC